MNLSKYDEWQDTEAAFWATVFLDCVVSEFLNKAKHIQGLERAIASTEKGRAVGLGAMGLHSLFQSKGLPFESMEAFLLNGEVFKHIEAKSKEATIWLAKILGEPEWCKGLGIRNTHLTAVAPTKSSSVIMGGVSEGISPDVAMVFTAGTAGGEIPRINPQFLKLMKSKGKYTDETITSINLAHGSVQHLDWLSDEEKAVYKTAFEIDQRTLINMASSRQSFIDQSQSLNLFFSAEETEGHISGVHSHAFRANIKSLYYVNTKTGINASEGDECLACSA